MKLITLVENTCGREGCVYEHGLSIYIETDNHRLLMDAGQTDAAVKNADALGIDLSSVDTVILSHGHYDHSGGILPFSKRNGTAAIYMQSEAALPHFSGERYNGIDLDILSLPNVKLISGDARIDEELFLFTGITGRRCFPEGNKKLLTEKNGVRTLDDFRHEQCLVISQEGKSYLLSGCAHNGILNILDRYREIFGSLPDVVISGFHMMKREGEHTQAERDVIIQTARELSATDTLFFSGHCTGQPAFDLMKDIMGDRLRALHSGCEINIL